MYFILAAGAAGVAYVIREAFFGDVKKVKKVKEKKNKEGERENETENARVDKESRRKQ